MFIWRRGSTFELGLRVIAGTIPGGATAACQMKPALADNTSPGDSVAAALTLTATPSDDGWVFTGSAAQSVTLKPGRYVADAKVEAGGKTVQTEPVVIEVLERVTA